MRLFDESILNHFVYLFRVGPSQAELSPFPWLLIPHKHREERAFTCVTPLLLPVTSTEVDSGVSFHPKQEREQLFPLCQTAKKPMSFKCAAEIYGPCFRTHV
ncbi:hypothetical protein CDAR_41461 [Caerostris darwini]|uniref:Uncharacterized protein n=1 Tax=Caerostris darwini TaxID=1538125 RepID=A0AAV4R3I7_9ARAC|nr:hypothetical protein CDAR_41461 [Caerostris darwini]